MENRVKLIRGFIPKDVKTVLDIGSRGEIFNQNYKTTNLDVVEDADIKQDLNVNQKLNFPDDSFDMVVLNQILEHLNYVEEIIKEAKRVSRKYIFVGLPNEAVYSLRIRFLFGKIEQPGYSPYGHKHRYGIKEVEEFIRKFFGDYEKKIFFGAFTGARFLSARVVRLLANLSPPLFAKEVYYLIKLK
jgi:hypothetical protein